MCSFSGKKRKGIGSVTTDVNKPEGEVPAADDGSRLVISGGEGYVDFRIGDDLLLPLVLIN